MVERLRELGHEVVTSREAGNANKRVPDEEVLRFATNSSLTVITTNRIDFVRLHKHCGYVHGGIIACTEDRDFIGQAERIHEAIKNLPVLAGLLVKVYRPAN